MTFRRCLPPFQDRYSRGPYYYQKWGRFRIDLLSPLGKGHCKTMTYARYLQSVHQGFEPVPPYEVDHIDGDRTHDMIGNLRMITKSENSRKGRKSDTRTNLRHMLRMECPCCKNVFDIPHNKTHLGRKTGDKTYCSRKCSVQWRSCQGVVQQYIDMPPPPIVHSMRIESWACWSLVSERTRKVPRILAPINCSYCKKVFSPARVGQHFCCKKCAHKDLVNRRALIADEEIARVTALIQAKSLNWSSAGRLLGVSDNAIRKRAKRLGLLE